MMSLQAVDSHLVSRIVPLSRLGCPTPLTGSPRQQEAFVRGRSAAGSCRSLPPAMLPPEDNSMDRLSLFFNSILMAFLPIELPKDDLETRIFWMLLFVAPTSTYVHIRSISSIPIVWALFTRGAMPVSTDISRVLETALWAST